MQLTLSHFKAIALFVITLLTFSPANAAICNPSDQNTPRCLNEECSTLGATQMDKDKQNILACLEKDTSHALIWKATTGQTNSQSFISVHPDAIVCHDNNATKVMHIASLDLANSWIIYTSVDQGAYNIHFHLDGTRYTFNECLIRTVPSNILAFRNSQNSTEQAIFGQWASSCSWVEQKCNGLSSLQQIIANGKAFNIASPYKPD